MTKRYKYFFHKPIYSLIVMGCLSMIGFNLTGCDGPAGPAGTTGPSGPTGATGNANVNVSVFSFEATDLIEGNDSTYYYLPFSDSTIESAIDSGAAVLVYLGANSVWNPLPYTEPHEPALSINYYLDNQSVYIEVISSYDDARGELIDFLGRTYQLRVIVIPANNVYLSKILIGRPSYNEIKSILKLQD